MDDERYYAEACEIDARIFGKDYDDADKEIVAQQIAEANQGDNDEAEAIKYGY